MNYVKVIDEKIICEEKGIMMLNAGAKLYIMKFGRVSSNVYNIDTYTFCSQFREILFMKMMYKS